jgi:tetratricopeptide (TPR) repeat protein
MPWIELLILLSLTYVAVLVVRGIVQVVPWFIETFVEPRRFARPREASRPPRSGAASPRSSVSAPRREKVAPVYQEKVALAVWRATCRLTDLWAFFRWLFARKDFGYWVGSALAESDPEKKVAYCSKALRLNPGYEPAWGLKAITLLGLQRYEEAIPCFDKVLELRPNAAAWCWKGTCCHRLGRYQEAVGCFGKALATCAAKDRQLFDEASRQKKLADEALRSRGLEGGKS